MIIGCCASPPRSRRCLEAAADGGSMPGSQLKGACIWKGAEIARSRCDVAGLLCVRRASEGGVSKLASSATVYNEILERRPDLHALLCRPIPRSRFGEEAGGEHVAYDLPVFGLRDGKLTSHYSLTYIEYAQMIPGVRKLSAAEHEAIRLLMA